MEKITFLTGKPMRLIAWVLVTIIGTVLATSAFGQVIPNYNARENDRIVLVKEAWDDLLLLTSRQYCEPRQNDLREKIEIKASLGEDTGLIQSELKLLATPSGCREAIKTILGFN